nr:MAG TPA: hypothetical protein [Bacteriophage sp.]
MKLYYTNAITCGIVRRCPNLSLSLHPNFTR